MRRTALFSALVLSLGLAAGQVGAQAPAEPYEVEVWADAEYAASGELVSLEFVDAGQYPDAFLANLRSRIAAREYTAPVVDGQPASFETGVRVQITVTPGAGGGQVKIDAITDSARVVRMTEARIPAGTDGADWNGVLIARCLVTAKGRCNLAGVEDRSGMDGATADRFAKSMLSDWRFKPQRVGGKPIESEVTIPIRLEAAGTERPTIRGRQY
ncbi:hypothetical protein [Arenimonas sp. MALMAid1274]|uniref:hypothetical protein n=1 Tax=Arenimonas sp. MALMAid1274 TaxID=3411630 RepID=UPI003B9E5BC3